MTELKPSQGLWGLWSLEVQSFSSVVWAKCFLRACGCACGTERASSGTAYCEVQRKSHHFLAAQSCHTVLLEYALAEVKTFSLRSSMSAESLCVCDTELKQNQRLLVLDEVAVNYSSRPPMVTPCQPLVLLEDARCHWQVKLKRLLSKHS